MHVRTVQHLGSEWLSSNMALLLSPSHTVTGCGTIPGSSGTGCWPMSWETDCDPHRADNADRLHTQTVCFLAGMISCERRYQSCSGHGRNPFRWHLSKKRLRVEILFHVCHYLYSAVIDLPTPPKGRATIRLWRMLSFEQKLPLEVSLISLVMTCIIRKSNTWSEYSHHNITVNIECLNLNHTLLLLEYAYTQRGFSCLFMKAIASSTLFTVRTGRTGPKMSCCMMGFDSVTSVKIVGASERIKIS